ncbi:VOC family protein [Celeribacter baekdonensis]|uniref:VOC domain-containing protein n=1 Tax=Celeribacter baekdonensis TaxID=875171 RepID=A0A2R4M4A6_9RHOB|nr:VOC family protein [Celeribacter baekdonensis]AVW91993.1 hypothetical protein DA792_13655 [Celeribacter baekdonensis]
MINGIHHPSLVTGDMDRALGFYRDLLGLETVSEMGWEAGSEMSDFASGITGIKGSTARAMTLKAGNAFLEIFEYSKPEPKRDDTPTLADKGIAHICFDVADVQGAYDTLSAAGVPFVGTPLDAGPTRVVFCQDPDGNFVELQQVTNPASGLKLG